MSVRVYVSVKVSFNDTLAEPILVYPAVWFIVLLDPNHLNILTNGAVVLDLLDDILEI